MTSRRPDITTIVGKDTLKECDVKGCIDFTVQNTGDVPVWIGFSRDSAPEIQLDPGELAPFPLYRPCETWDIQLFIKFVQSGSVRIIKTN